ncbi:MAG: hypothetical protein AAGE98_07730 [Actinomycetota bacterium]
MDGMRAIVVPSRARIRRELASLVLQPLLVAVGAMIGLHLAEVGRLVDTAGSPISFSLGADRSLAELLGYVITAMIIAGLVDLARRHDGDRMLFALAGLFGFVLADDLLILHEQAGRAIAAATGREMVGDLPAEELGQFVYFLLVGIGVLVVGAVLWRCASPYARFVTAWVAGLLVVLAGLAVGLDLVHELVRAQTTALEEPLTVTEDGGELVVLALIASFVFARMQEDPPIDADDGLVVVVDDLVIDLRADASADTDSHSAGIA